MATVQAFVGRVRRTSVVSPFESEYISNMRQQMREITLEYERLINHIIRQSPSILMDALEPTFGKSQQYVPRKSGKLKNSGFLEIVEGGNRGSAVAKVVIGYAKSGDPPYAVFVHERLDLRHKPPTRAKFLQSALEEDAGVIQRRIIDGYEQAAGL